MGKVLKFEPDALQRRANAYWREKYGEMIRQSQREEELSPPPKASE
jgi:hypothetical protein